MKKYTSLLCATLVAVLVFTGHSPLRAALVQDFTDIAMWAGTGSNRSAVVLQWNDGQSPVSLAWGFQWDGLATGFDMLTAVAGSTIVVDGPEGAPTSYSGLDSRLTLTLGYSAGFGYSVRSIVFLDGAETRNNAGWEDAYWGYSLFGGDFEYYDWETEQIAEYNVPGSEDYADVIWFASPIGFSTRDLVDGAWDSWSFSDPTFFVPATEQPTAAVPEPGTFPLVFLGAVAMAAFRRRRSPIHP